MATYSVFLPGEFHGKRSLVGCCPLGHRVGRDWATTLSQKGMRYFSPWMEWHIDGTSQFYKDSKEEFGMWRRRQVRVSIFGEGLWVTRDWPVCVRNPEGARLEVLWRRLGKNRTEVWLFTVFPRVKLDHTSCFGEEAIVLSVCQRVYGVTQSQTQLKWLSSSSSMRWIPLILSSSFRWGNWEKRKLFSQVIQVAVTEV